ncbi:MAG: ArnT family glycosyltransferase, partial [Methyloligellaceae bacterium]
MSVVPSQYFSDHSELRSVSVDSWTRSLMALLGAVLLVKFYVAGVSNINWDEFYYLSHVHEQLNGTLTRRLQAFHVHLFGWLAFVSTNEADQVIAARAVMLALQGLTGYLLFRIACQFYRPAAALFSVLCYFSLSTVIQHGTSFRADPIATALLVAGLYFMLQPARTYMHAWISGALISLAAAITIKSVFYMPIFAAFMLIQFAQSDNRSLQVKQWILTVVTAGAGFVALYGIHLWLAGSVSSESAAKTIGHAYEKTILSGDFFPRWVFFQRTLIGDFVVWSAIIIGFILALRQLRDPDKKSRRTGMFL